MEEGRRQLAHSSWKLEGICYHFRHRILGLGHNQLSIGGPYSFGFVIITPTSTI